MFNERIITIVNKRKIVINDKPLPYHVSIYAVFLYCGSFHGNPLIFSCVCQGIRRIFETERLEDYYLMVIALIETKNSVVRKSEKSSQCKHTRELYLFDEDGTCCLICTRYEGLL